MKDEDFEDVYRSERSRGTRHPEHPSTITARRKQRKIVELILNPGCELRDFLSILRDFGLQEGSKEFERYVKVWYQRHGKP